MASTAEAGTPSRSASDPEVWLRSNPRPAVVLLAATVLAAAVALATAVTLRLPAWSVGLVAAAGGGCVGVAACVAWVASRPRLARRGGVLEVRLSPFRMERIPLEIVECVFPGSQPVGGEDGTADRRVGTLVLRLAERAAEWRSRPASAWGAWQDGSVVLDGRWCEPLSPPLARDLSARLLEARRVVVGQDAGR